MNDSKTTIMVYEIPVIATQDMLGALFSLGMTIRAIGQHAEMTWEVTSAGTYWTARAELISSAESQIHE